MQVTPETVTLSHEEYASLCKHYEEVVKARVDIENKYIHCMQNYIQSLKGHKSALEESNKLIDKYIVLQNKHEKLHLEYIELIKLLPKYIGEMYV